MPTTTNVKYSVPAHGANVDTWDADPINDNSNISDALFGSVTTKSLTNAPVTLTDTEARVSILRFTGTLTGNVAITVSAIRKSWVCENNTLGNFVVTITGGSGNVVGLPPGSSQVYWDGTNVSFINMGRIGDYWDYPSTAVPAWVSACTVPPYLLANGGAFSAVTYPILNQILGGTTLPDARGRARFALNGGTGRLTSTGGIDGDTRFAAGGDGDGLVIGQTNLPNVNFTVSGITLNDTHSHPMNTQGVGVAPGGINVALRGGGADVTGNNSTPITVATQGSAASGGSGTALASVSPGYVGGITMIRAG